MMHDLPRRQLAELVARHGRGLAADPRRCKALLLDYCWRHRREVSALVLALEEHVAADLLAARPGTPRAVLLAQLAARLCDNLALSEQAARWAVGSWALALGAASGELIEELEAAAARAGVPAKAAGTPAQGPGRAGAAEAAPAAARANAGGPITVSAKGDGHYLTIGEALRDAASGARLLVKPGRYEESLVLDKPVEIVGDGRREEIVVASAGASCVRMQAARAVVRGLTLRGRAGDAGEESFAVDVPQGRLLLEDCDVSSETLSCVGIHGSAADPLLRRCAIHGGADSGVYAFEQAAGTIEECDIFGNANVNVAVALGARPVLRACKIHDGRDAGIVVWDGAAGVIEDCEVYGNRSAGVGISDRGEPVVRRCSIYHGQNSGVYVHRGGRGHLEECNIYGNREANVAVARGGWMTARGCLIHNGKAAGVFLDAGGRGQLVGCEVNGNAQAGVVVRAGAEASIRGGSVRRNGTVGVLVMADGGASVEDCDLTGNGVAPFEAEYGAHVEGGGNVE